MMVDRFQNPAKRHRIRASFCTNDHSLQQLASRYNPGSDCILLSAYTKRILIIYLLGHVSIVFCSNELIIGHVI